MTKRLVFLLLITSFIQVTTSAQNQHSDAFLQVDTSMGLYFNALRLMRIDNAENILDTKPKWNSSGLGNDLLRVYQGDSIEIKIKDSLSSSVDEIFQNLIFGYQNQNSDDGSVLQTYQSLSLIHI